ncbi:universal stress protein [Weissella cibaria]|nr:universal stress protein [Weissella cibaria]
MLLKQQAGVTNLTVISETGNPKNIIAKVIPAQYDIDLIVIGATGMNAVERLMQGSVTEFVSRTSRVNTFIVHAD